MDRPLPQLSLKERRDRTVELLCEHFTQDRLEVAEFEARLDVAHRATTAAELDALLEDMPAAPTAEPAPAPGRDALARGSRVVLDAVRDARTMIAFIGGVERRGPWVPARKNIVIAVMGGAVLDFREVQLPPGVTDLFLFCIMGGAEIIVPPSLAVDASGIAIMGGFEHSSPARSSDPDQPVLRVNGVCIMGGVEIQVRREGESARDAQQRKREEQRALREGRRRSRGEE